MFTFLNLFFRKNFYDGWDNVISLFTPNLMMDFTIIICTALCIPGVTIFKESSWYLYIWILMILIGFCAFGIISIAWAYLAAETADYGTVEFKDFFKRLKASIPDGIKYGITVLIILIFSVFNVKYFLFPANKEQSVTFAGLLAGFVYLWVSLVIFMALAWLPAVKAKMNDSYLKTVKKCFIIFLDNLFPSIVISIYDFFLCIISIIMMGSAPGLAGVGLSRANALRLILKKYDYIDELNKNGEAQDSPLRRNTPWKDLLKDDLEANPPRTFKEFWMPWKSN